MAKSKIILSMREKQILAFFKDNDEGIIEDIALHFTGESRQNLFNPGIFRFKCLGVLKETEDTKETTNNGTAKIYVRGRNFDRIEYLNPELDLAIKAVRSHSKATAKKKNMTYRQPKDVKAAVVSGKLSRASLNSSIAYHRKNNPMYAEILIGGRQLLK